MAKTDRRIQKTKDSIQKAFLEILEIKDYNSITVTELANTANIDRKTFYLHYSSIADVLKEFESELANKLQEITREGRSFGIGSFLRGLNNLVMENMNLYRRISETTPNSLLMIKCKNILKNSIKGSFFNNSGMSNLKSNVYAEYIASGIIGIYTEWFTSNTSVSLEELTEIVKDAVSNGWDAITE